MTEAAEFVQIAVVGDVHDRWDKGDRDALENLGADLVLLVGDFGNESVAVVREIAALELPMAAILGNHDAWYSATPWGRQKCPYNRDREDWLEAQLELLGDRHVGYRSLEFADLGLSVAGARPFSWGGSEWKYADFYRDRYGINSFDESAKRIFQAIAGTASEATIVLGHNGPTGLGDAPEDPCGRDWRPIGGDFGDPDFARAIALGRQAGKTIPLVAFGHMHHQLRHRKDRLRRSLHVDEFGTVYLNAASVPRIENTAAGPLRNFCWVWLRDRRVERVALRWADASGRIASEQVWYEV